MSGILKEYQCDNCGRFVSRDDGFYHPPLFEGEPARLCCDKKCSDALLKKDHSACPFPPDHHLSKTTNPHKNELEACFADLQQALAGFDAALDRAVALKNTLLRSYAETIRAGIIAAQKTANTPAAHTVTDLMALSMQNAFVRAGVIHRADLIRDGFNDRQITENYQRAFELAATLEPGLAALAEYQHA